MPLFCLLLALSKNFARLFFGYFRWFFFFLRGRNLLLMLFLDGSFWFLLSYWWGIARLVLVSWIDWFCLDELYFYFCLYFYSFCDDSIDGDGLFGEEEVESSVVIETEYFTSGKRIPITIEKVYTCSFFFCRQLDPPQSQTLSAPRNEGTSCWIQILVQLCELGIPWFVLPLKGFFVQQAPNCESGLAQQVCHAAIVLSAPLVEQRGEVNHLSRFDFITIRINPRPFTYFKNDRIIIIAASSLWACCSSCSGQDCLVFFPPSAGPWNWT